MLARRRPFTVARTQLDLLLRFWMGGCVVLLTMPMLMAFKIDNPPDLMFANKVDIRRVQMERKTAEPVVENLLDVEALDFDVQNRRMYWADRTLNKISSGYVNGSSVEEVSFKTMMQPQAICVDWVGHNIIWADSDPRVRAATGHDNDVGRLMMKTYDGNFTRAIIWTGIGRIRSIAMDPKTGFIYWSDRSQKKIERSFPDGSNRSIVIKGNMGVGMTIDYAERQLYWTDPTSNSIKWSSLHDFREKTLIQNRKQIVYPYAITTLGDYVYWTDMHKNAILVAAKKNGKQRSIVENQLWHPQDIGAFDKGRQPDYTSVCALGQSPCSNFCLNMPPGYKCSCPTGVKLLSDGVTCATGLEKFIVYARRPDIRVLSLDVPLDETIDVIMPLNTSDASDVGYDVVEDFIYWTNNQADKAMIERGNFDGSVHEIIISEMAASFNGVAVDWISRNLYWMDNLFDRLMVSRLDGSFKKTLISTDLDLPRAIVVDPVEGYMYWTDWGSQPKMEKAALDGTDRRVLIDRGVRWPNGLAVDYIGRRLYWADASNREIETSDLWGRDRRVLLHVTVFHPYGLTIVGQHVYWTDWLERSVERAPKMFGNESTGSRTSEMVLSPVPDVMGIYGVDRTILTGSNACSKQNGGCSHLCLPKPEGKSCACPDYFLFSDSKQTQCKAPIPRLLYTHYAHIHDTDDTGNIHSITIDNTFQGKTLPLPNQAVINPVAIAYDSVERTVYWSDKGRDEIRRANLMAEDLDVSVIVPFGSANPGGLVVDWMGHNVYWTVLDRDRIDMCRLDGSLRTPFKWKGVRKPKALTIEPQHGLLYWSTWSETPQIQSALLTNSSGTKTLTTLPRGYRPCGLTIDHSTRWLYWTDSVGYSISTIDVTAENPVKILILQTRGSRPLDPSGVAFFNGSLYWANLEQEEVQYAKTKLDRMKRVKMLSKITKLDSDDTIDVAVADYMEQSGISQCSTKNGGCSHYCVSASGSRYACGCPMHLELGYEYSDSTEMTVCKVPHAVMVYAVGQSMYLVNLTAPDATKNQSDDAPLPLDINSQIENVELDIVSGRIFWTDINGHLHGSMLDGRGHRLLVQGGRVFDMAVNYVTGQVFYTNEEADTIEAIWATGESVGVVIDSRQLNPRSLALDSNSGFLYWTDWGAKPSIRSAELDGKNIKELIITDLKRPRSLTLDVTHATLYWTDWERNVIGQCDVAGQNRKVFQPLRLDPGVGLAFSEKYLYYTMPSVGSILQLDKKQSVDRSVMNSSLSAVWMRMGLKNLSDVVVYVHKAPSADPCSVNNGNCSHLCIPIGNGLDRCACPVNQILQTDQHTCSGPSCSAADEVQCDDGARCISSKQLCDGVAQCFDRSDEEKDCLCQEDEVRCPTGKCILELSMCDGIMNCPNGWDESTSECPCPEEQTSCANGRGCVPLLAVCDGKEDCGDGSDEQTCVANTTGSTDTNLDDSSTESLALILSCVTAGILIPLVVIFVVVGCRLRSRKFSPSCGDHNASAVSASLGQGSMNGGSRLTESVLLEKLELDNTLEGVSVYAQGLLPIPQMPLMTPIPTDGETEAFTMPPPMGGPIPTSETPCDPPPSVVTGQTSAFTTDSPHIRKVPRLRRKSSGSRYRYRSSESDYRPSAPCPSATLGSSSDGDSEGTSGEETSRSRSSRRLKKSPPLPVSRPMSFVSDSRYESDTFSTAVIGDLCPPPPPTVVTDYTETAV